MLWIALAAQVSAVVAEKPGNWISGDDTPIYLVRQGPGLWQVPIRVEVAPDGKVQGCDVERTSGIADLDRFTCRLVVRRPRFGPARIDNVPAFGVYRATIMWVVADAAWDTSKMVIPDLDISVENLPAELESPTLVAVMFAVDAAGRISSCAADDEKGDARIEENLALVPVACEQIIKAYRAIPGRDATGKPVVSVQNALVRFSAAQPQQ